MSIPTIVNTAKQSVIAQLSLVVPQIAGTTAGRKSRKTSRVTDAERTLDADFKAISDEEARAKRIASTLEPGADMWELLDWALQGEDGR